MANVATICLNGHVLSTSRAHSKNFCPKCGTQTFSECIKCSAPVPGSKEPIRGTSVLRSAPYIKPLYCDKCGEPYPWTRQILDNAVELVSLDDDLPEASRELIKNAIPGLLVDSSTTPVAVNQFQKGISNASQIVKDCMRQLLVDVICESAKKMLGY